MANLANPSAREAYCEKWKTLFRAMGQELRNMTDVLLKWMAYDQGIPANTGSKWTEEEQELLRQALLTHGDDMDKICEILSSRSEQAIRAAIKRKMDPEMLQQIGPIKKRKHGCIVSDSIHDSPLACYFSSEKDDQPEHNVGESNQTGLETSQKSSDTANVDSAAGPTAPLSKDHTIKQTALTVKQPAATVGKSPIGQIKPGTSASTIAPTSLKALQSGSLPTSSEVEGWAYGDSGVELTDYDFLAILEDDPAVLADALVIAGIPTVDLRVRADVLKADEVLREESSEAPDIIFWNNFKAPLREVALELGVYAERNGMDDEDLPRESEQVVVDGPVPEPEEPHDMVNGVTVQEHLANSNYDTGLTGSEIEEYLMETDAAVEALQSAEFL
ncbi:uncharacterized protein LOC129582388 [Paramacrobiotus metropolitanus]|uniref:uncharacterized protein LOC129582388 n=1 Tax=Paramacrobiotus metropolitanus TaxID=2943436 RepID=UPI002445DEE4|nr:uncharacterized protein LOC129582388 [Paramacrobiotus metropolitanus]XP_055329883.1 uncharacterized protein LOC129582388 [Paramacrobiotus metropolitanus]XP_055329890.1 uncharacterized protein LOC129582388 [Paramacrobiotus metropolitanus]XP_055329898.1 uncharacterized protein LOC129582388 [Paramacrobiotus metropolitanus]